MIASSSSDSTPFTDPVRLKKQSSTIVQIDDGIIKMKDYLSGHNWTLDYYSLSTGYDDVNIQLDQGSPLSEQHYIKYNDLRVNLLTSIDTQSINNINGSIIITKLVPQVNDLLKARLPTGDIALFRINEVKPINYSLDVIYEVNFVIDTIEAIDPSRIAHLEEAVIRNLYYSTDSIYSKGDSILLSEEHQLTKDISKAIFVFTKQYMKLFSKDLISYSYDNSNYYSPVVDSMARTFLSSEDLSNIGSREYEEPVFIDFLNSYGTYEDLYFNIEFNKFKTNVTVDQALRYREVVPSSINYIVNTTTILEPQSSLPTFNSYLYDGSLENPYFLYSKDSTCEFSLLITKYLANDILNRDEILKLLELELTEIEYYYFMPLVIMLLKYSIGKIYTK